VWRSDPLSPLPNLRNRSSSTNKVQQGRSKLRNSFCVKVWTYKEDRATLFSLNIKRDNDHGLWPGRFTSDIRKNFFTKKD